MYTYSFKITKGKYELSLSTTDKDMVVEQFAQWVKKASNYVSRQKSIAGKERVKSQINAERELTQRNINEQLKRSSSVKPIEAEHERPLESRSVEKELDTFYAPKQETEQVQNTINSKSAVFDDILDKSLNIDDNDMGFKSSPSIKKDNAFINYISGRKIERKIDYLLLTAYYFTQFEQKPRFTLKQLNAKLMQNLAVILDHSVIQEGLNRDYIECLPDLTGVVGASEYRLTAYGEKILLEQ